MARTNPRQAWIVGSCMLVTVLLAINVPAANEPQVKDWTYIRIICYDALWGIEGPIRDEVEYHLEWMQESADDESINLVLIGDWWGDEGSLYGVASETAIETIDQPELNMGDPATYQAFFEWVVANYPAERYALSLWGHGSGIARFGDPKTRPELGEVRTPKAIGIDSTDNDSLSSDETGEVLRSLAQLTGRSTDIFFVCACLTNMVENAYPLRDSVQFLVAGESVVGCGGDLLDAMHGHLDESARWIADEAVSWQWSDDWEKDVVFSSINLAAMDELLDLLDELTGAMQRAMVEDWVLRSEVWNLVNEVQSMSYSRYPSQARAYLDLVDLFIKLSTVSHPAVAARADELRSFAEGQLISSYMIQNNDAGRYSDAHGIAIYHPTPRYHYLPGSYKNLSFAGDSFWDEYMSAIKGAHPPWRSSGQGRLGQP